MNPHRLAVPSLKTLSLLAFTTLAGLAIGQAALLNLNTAIQQAFSKGPDLASSIATLKNAQADLAAKEADPSTLIKSFSLPNSFSSRALVRLTKL